MKKTLIIISFLLCIILPIHVNANSKNLEVFNEVLRSYLQNNGSDLKVGIDLTEGNSINYNLQYFKPIVNNDVCKFFQGSYNSRNETLNLGIGKRWETIKYVFGANAFADICFKHDHVRVGLGTELFTKDLVFRGNYYKPITGEAYMYSYVSAPYTITHVYSKPLTGYDLEVGTNLKNLNFYLNKFGYKNIGDKSNSGTNMRVEFNVNGNLTLEGGRVDADGCDSKYYGKFTYDILGKRKIKDMLTHNFTSPVVRNNEIKTVEIYKTETLSEDTATLKLTVKDSTGNRINGATVKLISGANVKEQFTDITGEVTFKKLPAGTYSVKIIKYGYVESIFTLNIAKGETRTLNSVLNDNILNLTVKNSNDQLISGATVYLILGDFPVDRVTNENGVATFTNLPEGNCSLRIFKYGYIDLSTTLKIEKGKSTQLTERLINKDPVNNTSLTLKIKDANGNAVLKACTYIALGNLSFHHLTNASGEAVYTQIKEGTYSFEAFKEGYNDLSTTITVDKGVNTVSNQTLNKKDPLNNASIEITVVDETNAPLADSTVLLGSLTQITNTYGKTTFTGLIAATHTLKVSKTGYYDKSITCTVAKNENGKTTCDLKKYNAELASCTVTVRDENGASVFNASVTMAGQTKFTDGNGKVSFTNLTPGDYAYTVKKANFVDCIGTQTLAKGSNVFDISLQTRTGDYVLIVHDQAGQPITGATIASIGTNYISGVTDSDGNYKLVKAKAGTHLIKIEKADYYDVTSSIIIAADDIASSTFKMNKIPNPVLKVTVKDENDQPISGIPVQFGTSTLTTDSAGQVVFSNLIAGTYICTVIKNRYETFTESITVSMGDVIAKSYKLVP